MPETLKLPYGYRIYNDIVVCDVCRRQWHVPESMHALSDNARQLLVEHHDLHSGSSSPYLIARPQVIVNRPFERRKVRSGRKRP